MCSSISGGKEQRLIVPRVLLWPTSFFHRGVDCRMQCSRLRAGCRLGLPFIGSAHYIRTPKLAKGHQKEIGTSCQNQCCGTVTIFYGSGSGSDFWKVMVPVPIPTFEKVTVPVLVPVPAPYLYHKKQIFLYKFVSFLHSKLFYKEKVYKYQQIYCKMWKKKC
jgi:hypothetical protein